MEREEIFHGLSFYSTSPAFFVMKTRERDKKFTVSFHASRKTIHIISEQKAYLEETL
jgi:hypothetical protein